MCRVCFSYFNYPPFSGIASTVSLCNEMRNRHKTSVPKYFMHWQLHDHTISVLPNYTAWCCIHQRSPMVTHHPPTYATQWSPHCQWNSTGDIDMALWLISAPLARAWLLIWAPTNFPNSQVRCKQMLWSVSWAYVFIPKLVCWDFTPYTETESYSFSENARVWACQTILAIGLGTPPTLYDSSNYQCYKFQNFWLSFNGMLPMGKHNQN